MDDATATIINSDSEHERNEINARTEQQQRQRMKQEKKRAEQKLDSQRNIDASQSSNDDYSMNNQYDNLKTKSQVVHIDISLFPISQGNSIKP